LKKEITLLYKKKDIEWQRRRRRPSDLGAGRPLHTLDFCSKRLILNNILGTVTEILKMKKSSSIIKELSTLNVHIVTSD
jgi:hypothetical protein